MLCTYCLYCDTLSLPRQFIIYYLLPLVPSVLVLLFRTPLTWKYHYLLLLPPLGHLQYQTPRRLQEDFQNMLRCDVLRNRIMVPMIVDLFLFQSNCPYGLHQHGVLPGPVLTPPGLLTRDPQRQPVV